MKSTPRTLVYFTTTALAIGALCFQEWYPTISSQHAPSVLVQARAKSNGAFSKVNLDTLHLAKPAPLDHPSEQELADFPGATVVESEEIDDPEVSGQKIRMRILKTNFKSPYIRTEEMVDADSGSLLGRSEMAADHFLLNLPEGSDPQEVFNHFGPEVASMEPLVPGSGSWVVHLANASLETLPDVLWFQSAGIGEPDRIYGLNDLIISQLNENQWALPKISAPEAWNIRSMAAKPVTVAIIDTGIRYTHQDLQGNMWTNPDPAAPDQHGTNAVAGTGDPMDDCGHGTHCAGIIGATGVGVKGVAPQVQLMACKYMDAHGKGMLSDEVACLHYAVDHGATVLNCSYGIELGLSKGGFSIGTPFSLFSKTEYEAMKYAGEKGVLLAIAAGNSSNNNDGFPAYPSSYCVDNNMSLLGNQVAPALDNIVSVAATDEQDQLCDFSNYGVQSVFIGAPGNNILSTWNYSDTAYTFLRGTSMAAPHVAGALALMKAKFSNRSNQELIAHLLEATDSLDSLQGKTKSGGRLNLLKALTWD
ncbi:MAG: S8 family peptidase [Verrucomicrobiae bacterium]|nr:S8 family peptidase [Verrucomicrobiae bacterium]